MASKNTKSTQAGVVGVNIYQDSRGRNVYYNRLTGDGYVISPANVSKYNFYAKRFILPLIAFALLSTMNVGGYELGIFRSALICGGLALAMEYYFRFRFLKSLTTIPNFKPEKKQTHFQKIIEAHPEKPLLIVKSLLYLALGIVFVFYAYESNYDLFEWIIVLLVCLVSCGYGIMYIAAFIHSLKK